MENEHQFYMGFAFHAASASRARRLRVGAVIVKDGNILAFGYNGTPKGFENDCEDGNGNTKPEVLHAESNAIAKCARSTQSAEGADLYITDSPCVECAKLIIQSGIRRVFYTYTYRVTTGIGLLHKAGITTKQIEYENTATV